MMASRRAVLSLVALAVAPGCLGLRLPVLRASPHAVAAVAACVLCTATAVPSVGAADPTAPLPPAVAAQATIPTNADDARLVKGTSQRTTVASKEEVDELRAAADKIKVPDVPADSDLGRLLSGEASLPSSVSSPRAHGN